MATLKKCLGVDLGSHTVKVVELAIDRAGVKVLTAATAETDVDPAAPAEERREAMIKTMRTLLKKSKVSTREAVFAIPGQKVFIRRFRLPETTPERLERIVRYEARQQIPFPADKTDLQFEYFPIPEEKEIEVLLVAVRHDEVKEFMGLFDKCGLKTRAIGVSSFAVFNTQNFLGKSREQVQQQIAEVNKKKKKKLAAAAKSSAADKGAAPKDKKKKGLSLSFSKKKKGAAPEPEQVETQVEEEEPAPYVFEEVRGYVNIGGSATDLVIAQQGAQSLLKFSRSFPPGGNEVTRSVRQQLNIPSFADAERIKKHQTQLVTFDFDMMGDEANVNRDASTAATQAVDRIISEVRRSLDFFISQPDGMAVDTLVLSGGMAELKGMVSYVEEKLTIPTTKVETVPQNSGLIWNQKDVSLAQLVPAIGLALQGIGMSDVAVDFLPEERKITRDFPYKVVAVLAVLLAGIVFFTSQSGKAYREEYARATSGLEATVNNEKQQFDKEKTTQEHHDRVGDLYSKFRQGVVDRDYWLEFLALMEQAKPPEVLILGVTGDYEGKVTIVGASESRRSAGDFNTALKELLADAHTAPTVESVGELQGAQSEAVIPGAQRAYRFTISLQTSDKLNTMRVTPTPGPTMAGGQPLYRQPPGRTGGGRVAPGGGK